MQTATTKAHKVGQTIDVKTLKVSPIKVYTTSDYDMFTLSEFNRKVTLSKKLLESVKHNDLTMFNPILIDNKGVVIDGQHRLLVCKSLDIPVYFIVSDEVKVNDSSDINCATRNWSTDDYITHFAKREFDSYKKLIKFGKQYEMPLTSLLSLGKASADKNETIPDLVRSGKFQFRESDAKVKEVLENFKDFKEYVDFASQTMFFKSYARVVMLPEYNHTHMIAKLKEASGTLHRQPTQQLQIDEILKLYNYGAKRKKLELDKQGSAKTKLANAA